MMADDMDKKTEESLDTFLKRYDPTVPPPNPGERQRILRAMVLEHAQGRLNQRFSIFAVARWLVPALAAAVFLFILWSGPFRPIIQPLPADLVVYLDEMLGEVYSDRADDLTTTDEEGEDYLLLAELVSASR